MLVKPFLELAIFVFGELTSSPESSDLQYYTGDLRGFYRGREAKVCNTKLVTGVIQRAGRGRVFQRG